MRIVLLLVSLGLSYCTMPPPVEPVADVPLGEPFALPIDQAAAVSGTRVILGFSDVSDDSRCAEDVQCVWEGNAVVHLTVVVDGTREEVDLNTTIAPRSAVLSEYVISLENLQPAPHSSRAIERESYVATLRVVPAAEEP